MLVWAWNSTGRLKGHCRTIADRHLVALGRNDRLCLENYEEMLQCLFGAGILQLNIVALGML